MTKAQYIDFIRNSLHRVDQTAKYHPNQVAIAIENAFNTVFYEMYAINPRALDVYAKQMTDVAVLTDSVTGRYYALLTKSVVNLPTKSSGVLTVNTVTGTNLSFVPMTDMEMEQVYDLDASLPQNIIGYSVQPGRLEFYNMNGNSAGYDLRVFFIQPFSDYAATDEVTAPHGQDAKIMDLVRQFLAGTPPVKLTNDNSDNNG